MPVGVGGKPASPPGGGARAAAPAGKPAPPPSEPPAGAAPAKGGKMKLLVIILIVLLVLALAAGGALFAMKLLGGGESNANAHSAPQTQQVEEQEVVAQGLPVGKVSISTGDPININLADGKYLAFSATVYFDETVEESVKDPSPARDVAFRLFNGMKVEELSSNKALEELQEKFLNMLNQEPIEPYHGHVAAVKFTNWAHT